MKRLLVILVLTLLSSKAVAFTSPTLTASEVVRSQDSRPKGLAFNNDGTKFYLTSSIAEEINVYDLTTAWDITTAVHKCAEPHWTTGNVNARHIAFSADGTFMFIVRGGTTGTDYVYRYLLSAPFDVCDGYTRGSGSDSSYVLGGSNFINVNSQQDEANGLAFSPDGKNMYITGTVGAKINQYTLSTAWDLTTAVHGGSFGFEDSSEETIPFNVTFNNDGTKMWMTGWTKDLIFEYDLSTAWDVRTATLFGEVAGDFVGWDDGPSTFVFSPDASKMFVLGSTDDKVSEFKLYCTYGIVACQDPTSDKDDVASVESQTESAKQLIQHTTYPVLNRMEWLRRNNNSGNLTNQNIKFNFSNEILASLSNLIIPTYLSSNNSLTTELQSSGNWSYWSEGTISVGKVGDSLTSSAKNINTTAITIGADKSTDNGRMFGLALRFGNDDIDFGNVKNSLGMDAVSLTLYETRPHGEGKFIDSLIGIGTFKTDIVNAVGSSSTEGKRDGNQIFSSFKIRETFKQNKLNFTPKIKLDLGFTSLSDYSESGSTNLKFDRQNIGTIITSIGGAADSSSNLRNGTFKPYFEYDYFLDISPSSRQKISYISDTSSTYTLSNINNSTHNFKSKLGFDYITDAGWDITSSYQRTQSKENGYSDALYFGANYISRRNTEYAMSLDNNKAFLDYKRNINGFDITFGSNYTLMSAIPDYGATIEVSSKF